MDRRKKRTSTKQYSMYLELMEQDSIFASGRLPRDVDANYLHIKWKELSEKLNTCTAGPRLSAEEWRKRLNDWKNTTRCKYRRSLTGEKDVTMTQLEQKALSLFGKGPTVGFSEAELIHQMKNERDDADGDGEYHSSASTSFPKDLQAAVEEAIGDEDEDIANEQNLDGEGYVSDAVNESSVTSATANTANTANPAQFCAVLTDGSGYEDETPVEEVSYTVPKRKYIENQATNEVTTHVSNGESAAKRLRVHPSRAVIFQVKGESNVSRSIQTNNVRSVKPRSPYEAIAGQSVTAQQARDVVYQLKRIADLKAERLRFEIARFRFNNPGFQYNAPNL